MKRCKPCIDGRDQPWVEFARDFLKSSGFDDHFDLGSIFVNLRAYRGGTISTEIFVLIPFG
jgi:hypothetical protein